jgi:hypothetical protein
VVEIRNCSEITHDNYLSKCPSAASENLDIRALPFMPLPPMPAIFFFADEHLFGVFVTSNF